MKSRRTSNRHVYYWALLTVGLTACIYGPTIALFDQRSYENATSLKAEALGVMDRAGDPFVEYEDEVRRLMIRVEAAYEYAKGIPKNGPSAEQWEILRARNGALLWGFFELWEHNGTLLPGDVAANRKNVAAAFDSIIRLEAEKIRRE